MVDHMSKTLFDRLPLSKEPALVRSPHNNAFLTKSLFVEHNDEAILSFRQRDHTELALSLYKLYMHDFADPTEYVFAEEVLGEWEHWETLADSHFMREYIDKWREELKVQELSKLYARLQQDALNPDSRTSTSTAKFLVDKLEKTAGVKVGRPKGSKKKQETTRTKPVVLSSFEEDYERIKRRNVQ